MYQPLNLIAIHEVGCVPYNRSYFSFHGFCSFIYAVGSRGYGDSGTAFRKDACCGKTDTGFASGTGMPISTTHTLVGAVLGVGMARGIAAIDLGVVGRILLSWIVTIPAGALMAITFFFVLKAIFA